MDADWYEDPLGRYDGRFFDGDSWTNQVSNDGILATDPVPVDDHSSADASPAGRPPSQDASSDPAHTFGSPEVKPAAVAPLGSNGRRTANLLVESPGRTVAVLDDSFMNDNHMPSPRKSRVRLALLGAGLLAALLVGAFIALSADNAPDTASAQAELDDEQLDRMRDLEAGGGAFDAAPGQLDLALGAVDPSASFESSDRIQVGPLEVLNGASLLRDLTQWHQGFAAERGVTLSPTAGCWLGQLGNAAVQEVHCGPVSGSTTDDYLFDLVPIVFENVPGGQIAQPIVDAVVIDGRIANALEHVDGTGVSAFLNEADE